MKSLKQRLENSPVHLVKDASNWKKWWSMRLVIVSAAFQTAAIAYSGLPYDWTYDFPVWIKSFMAWGALITAISAGVARVIQQPNAPIPNIGDCNGPRNW